MTKIVAGFPARWQRSCAGISRARRIPDQTAPTSDSREATLGPIGLHPGEPQIRSAAETKAG
jgi:hypothetical protein